MTRRSFTRGLHEVGDGVFAYLQPGSWGWSNAGLVTHGDQSLLVDTLFDVKLTGDMLAAMRRATPAAAHIDTVVNTHANGDHCWGNQLVASADIVASRKTAEEMRALSPKLVSTLVKVARTTARIGRPAKIATRVLGKLGLRKLGAVGEAAEFITDIFGDFDFGGIELTPPTRTFDGALDIAVGDTTVQLLEVGPAHTTGDTIAFVPAQRTVFSGDILFINSHPIVWEGPIDNWIRACERIVALEPETIVPGHGPITDVAGVREVMAYLTYVRDESRARYDAGMSAADAARDIDLHGFDGWGERERIAVNVDTVYRELSGDTRERDPVEMFAKMARMRQ